MASEEPQPQVNIGDVTGSTFAVGNRAEARSYHGNAPTGDDDTERLLAALRELRADLSRTRRTEQTEDLDEALADADDEITRTGNTDGSRLRRLRELLGDAESLTAVLASAGTVAGLLGM
ncbi:hypothetical protein [Streptomyces oceani]|uniref:Uncharacterized protein n=1 Tax=Streptomyces oceani TaxID=1075402 RepID=A0A1E7KIU3_9ACTN|nr:hypothetical protein [Streptomyces oceani]OEV03902.1 hypothetical protein AN216_09670 [Streptomyces oceani]